MIMYPDMTPEEIDTKLEESVEGVPPEPILVGSSYI